MITQSLHRGMMTTEHMTRKLMEKYKKRGLATNIDKTEYTVCVSEQTAYDVTSNNETTKCGNDYNWNALSSSADVNKSGTESVIEIEVAYGDKYPTLRWTRTHGVHYANCTPVINHRLKTKFPIFLNNTYFKYLSVISGEYNEKLRLL